MNELSDAKGVVPIAWQRVKVNEQVISDGLCDYSLKAMKETPCSGMVAQSHPSYRAVVIAKVAGWRELQPTYPDNVDPFTERESKKQSEWMSTLCETITKMLLSNQVHIAVLAATVWYEKLGPGALLIMPTDDFMNFLDGRKKSKAKCQLWMQWIPKAQMDRHLGQFGSENLLGQECVRKNITVACTMEDSSGWCTTHSCVPILPELFTQLKFCAAVKPLVDLLSQPGWFALAVDTMTGDLMAIGRPTVTIVQEK